MTNEQIDLIIQIERNKSIIKNNEECIKLLKEYTSLCEILQLSLSSNAPT